MSAQTQNFQRKKKKVDGQQNHNLDKSKYPSVGLLSPCRTAFLLFVAYVFSCSGGRFMILLATRTCTCTHTHACAKTRACKHTHRPLFPPHQHSDNTEKPICSAATSRRENMSNSQSECFFPPLSLFPGVQKGFRTFILIFTHNLHLSGEAR